MALTISNQGNNKSGTSSATLAVTGNTASVGDWLLVVVAADNAGTDGASCITTCADAGGVNVYTKRGEITQDPGAANAGATLAFFTCPVTSAISASTITINFSPNPTRKLAHVYRIQPGANEVVTLRSTGAGAAGNGTSASITATSVTSGDTIFGAMSAETDDAITTDSDTTNGNWSTAQTDLQDDGTDANTLRIHSQWKTVNATGDQTYNLGIAAAQDWAINWIRIYPVPTNTLLANDVESNSEVTKPAVGQKHGLNANDVESRSEVTKPAITQTHNLLANDVQSASELTKPQAALAVSALRVKVVGGFDSGFDTGFDRPRGVATDTELSTPVFGQTHNLLANDVESVSLIGNNPVIGQIHVLTNPGVQSVTEIAPVVMAQTHFLLANDVESLVEVMLTTALVDRSFQLRKANRNNPRATARMFVGGRGPGPIKR
jgi:hypothetical protein